MPIRARPLKYRRLLVNNKKLPKSSRKRLALSKNRYKKD